jgi:hypothetical protein
MTEKELQQAFCEFNKRYFGDALASEVVVTENWVDAAGNYYPDGAVSGDLFAGTVNGTVVNHATATYTHSEDTIRIPCGLMEGKAAIGQLLHEMAHAAASEPETDHGPKWFAEMKRLYREHAPINIRDVTPGCTTHALVDQYGVGSDFWNQP